MHDLFLKIINQTNLFTRQNNEKTTLRVLIRKLTFVTLITTKDIIL